MAGRAGRIDREELVRRWCPRLTALDPLSPLSVGNGEFTFTADVTGLQTLPDAYRPVPLCTQATWAWHSTPRPAALRGRELALQPHATEGRMVGYPTGAQGQEALFAWLRENPHRLHLGRLGLWRPEGITAADLDEIDQTLDLWTGLLESRLRVAGRPVAGRTSAHPHQDVLAVAVEGDLGLELALPYGDPGLPAADWDRPEAHTTEVVAAGQGAAVLRRRLDATTYHVSLAWSGCGALERTGPHGFVLRPRGDGPVELVCRFSRRRPTRALPGVAEVERASAAGWKRFWTRGAAVELQGSADPRAAELERRIVLSQYLTAIQCAGSLPPAETGLTCNSWHGKFHLEMHWWHAAHFALWGRIRLLKRSLAWYRRILPAAQAVAAAQGYAGARWPKMTDPSGAESPSAVGPLLIWQQPHPIVFAELCYRAHPDTATLRRWREVVLETAAFMTSFAVRDGATGLYRLGPPLIPAQENHPPTTRNPTFELAYWRHGLAIAARWRQRLGLPPDPPLERVRANLAPLPVAEGVYLAQENAPDTYTDRNRDHPSMLGALGWLPGVDVDRETMARTLDRVIETWRFDQTWGWDHPMMAMTAARLGQAERAVDLLLAPAAKNGFGPNGHNYQRPSLPVYLPGNGALLLAVALMAGGWPGAPDRPAPGFPADGWSVRQEGLVPCSSTQPNRPMR